MDSDDIPTLFESCEPRDDVLTGELAEQQFSANLSSVAHDPDNAPEIYKNSEKFFEKTYETDGLVELLSLLTERFASSMSDGEFSGTNGLVSLDTSFGGGKTHNQIASLHLARHPETENLDSFVPESTVLSQYRSLCEEGGSVNTAVFVGTDVSPSNARCSSDLSAPDTNTMWGEIAYQLFGEEGYRQIKDSDRNQEPPGTRELQELFELSESPSLILIDEIASYLGRAASKQSGDTNLAELTNHFLFSLFELTENSDDVTVVLSVADTAFKDYAEEVRELIRDFNSLSERKEKPITPTSDSEIAAVLRHRLFKDVEMDNSKKIAKEYSQFYDRNAEDLPDEATTPEYREDIENHYPIHPSVINTLTEEIDLLPSFQRTRGALKLLARGVKQIWADENSHDRHLIRLYDLHPSDSTVKSTLHDLFNVVDTDFTAAINADIYAEGKDAHSEIEDQNWIANGHPPLGTHLTTTVLWKSIVVEEKHSRGLPRQQLRLFVAHPGVDIDHYTDALNNLTGHSQNTDSNCFYLKDDTSVKFTGEANTEKMITSVKERIESGVIRERLNQTIEGSLGNGDLTVIRGPEEPSEIPDNSEDVKLSIMNFDTVTASPETTEIPDRILNLYRHKSGSKSSRQTNRVYKNTVLFIVADEEGIEDAKQAAARVAAMERIQENHSRYDLNSTQLDELREKLESSSSLLGQAVRNAYTHLFYPTGDGIEKHTIRSVEKGEETKIHDMVFEVLDDLGLVLTESSGRKGVNWFNKKVWDNTAEKMSTKSLVEKFARNPDAELLLSPVPLRETIEYLVNEKGFAYWTGEQGYYMPKETLDSKEFSPADCNELTSSISANKVRITEDEFLFNSLESLIEKESITAPSCNECGELTANCVCEEICSQCNQEPCECSSVQCNSCGREFKPESDIEICEECRDTPLPKSVQSSTSSPESVEHAFAEVEAEISKVRQSVKDVEPSIRSEDMSTLADVIQIRVHGDDAWRRTWFISKLICDLGEDFDDLADYARIDTLTIESTDEHQESVFSVTYEGSIEDFYEYFRNDPTPERFIGESGEVVSEVTIEINLRSSSTGLQNSSIEKLKEKLSDTPQVGTIELAVKGQIEEDSSVMDE